MLRIRPTVVTAGLIAACALVPAVGAAAGSRLPDARPEVSYAGLTRPARPAAVAHDQPTTTAGSVFEMGAIHHYGQPANASGYSVILRIGPQAAWVFGGTNPGGPSAPVAAWWNGTALTTATLPSGLSSFISDASATSSIDIWAASQYGRYLLHYDGVEWQVARRWQHGQITGLTAVSPSDVWVFGTTANGTSNLGTWHFDGSSWQRVSGPAGSISRASATSAADIWAIAATPASYSILRYDGTSWQPVPTGTDLDGVQPHDILAISARDVWVVGTKANATGGERLVLLHWDGARWASLLAQINAWAGRLAMGANGSVLVTATPANASAAGLILQVSAPGGGRAVVTARSWLDNGSVSDVALAGGTRSLWASGAILTRLGGEAVIWTGQLGQSLDEPAVGA
jgi:hypothetical protein